MAKLQIILCLSIVTVTCGYHILCVQGGLSRSHFNLVMGINKILLKAGHEVTFITTYPDSKPQKNLHYINVSSALEIAKYVNLTDQKSLNIELTKAFGKNISKAILETPAVKQALIDTQFDAVVNEWFFSDVEAGIAAVQQAPWIVLCGTTLNPHIHQLVDIPMSLTSTPALMNHDLPPFTFMQRIFNTWSHFKLTRIDRSVESMYEDYFTPIAEARGVALPPFYEAFYNVSILFVNSDPTFAPAHSLPPNAIYVGGYHIDDEVPPLPEDLQEILDASSQGVVYFSFGSNIKSNTLPKSTLKELVDVFRQIPQTVLWKFEQNLPDIPKNLHIRSWMPQASILAHPNVKAFITHSGLLSTIEAVRFGVPSVTVPVYFDQPLNSLNIERAGHAIRVNFSPGMATDIAKALNTILHNGSYYQRAQQKSRMFKNRLIDPKALILHYVELAIESRGAVHLRPSHGLSWYQLWMLDQIGFVLITVYTIYTDVPDFRTIYIILEQYTR